MVGLGASGAAGDLTGSPTGVATIGGLVRPLHIPGGGETLHEPNRDWSRCELHTDAWARKEQERRVESTVGVVLESCLRFKWLISLHADPAAESGSLVGSRCLNTVFNQYVAEQEAIQAQG